MYRVYSIRSRWLRQAGPSRWLRQAGPLPYKALLYVVEATILISNARATPTSHASHPQSVKMSDIKVVENIDQFKKLLLASEGKNVSPPGGELLPLSHKPRPQTLRFSVPRPSLPPSLGHLDRRGRPSCLTSGFPRLCFCLAWQLWSLAGFRSHASCARSPLATQHSTSGKTFGLLRQLSAKPL